MEGAWHPAVRHNTVKYMVWSFMEAEYSPVEHTAEPGGCNMGTKTRGRRRGGKMGPGRGNALEAADLAARLGNQEPCGLAVMRGFVGMTEGAKEAGSSQCGLGGHVEERPNGT